MLITSLQQGKRDHMRANVYADGEFWAALEQSTIANYRLYQGFELSEESASEILFNDAVVYITRKLFDWYLRRPRSQREVQDKLSEKLTSLTLKNYSARGNVIDRRKLMDEVYAKLTKFGGSDEEFAHWFASERVRQGKSGSRKIIAELMAKGINSKLAQQSVAAVSGDESVLMAQLLQKKYGVTSLKEITDQNLRAKAYRFLMSKGFTKIS